MLRTKFLFSLILSSILLLSCMNRGSQKDITPAKSSTLLWKIEKNGTPVSYAFGTMHLIAEEYYYFPKTLKYLITNSDKVILEIGEKPGLLETMKLMRSNGENIFDYFSLEQKDSLYQFIDTVLNKNPEKIENSFGNLKPMMLQQFLSTAAFPEKWESYEADIYKLQSKAKAPYIGLETMEEQISILGAKSMEENVKEVMLTIRNIDSLKKEFVKLSQLHRAGNLEELDEMINAGDESFDLDELLYKRNLNWIPKIDSIISKESAFIAVGAGHLGGEKGILALLRKEGYTLTPLDY